MLNIKNKQNNITPQLIYMWERSNEHEEEFCRQDQKVIQTMQTVTSLEAHLFGKNNIKQTYRCGKYPLCDENSHCIGITFHLSKAQNFSISYYHEKSSPAALEFTPPSDILTQTEWEVLFLVLRSLDEEDISKELMLSAEDVINYIQSIYQKFNLPLHIELEDFCKKIILIFIFQKDFSLLAVKSYKFSLIKEPNQKLKYLSNKIGILL
ncbi:helix-turn-helix transcriptional regulator [Photorhabdus viridis]|uniref:helix-turn-helix transcriptional regulator n=1 Tax=Photorhabdus viridis TaxID=3163327 RepID=UPI003307655F